MASLDPVTFLPQPDLAVSPVGTADRSHLVSARVLTAAAEGSAISSLRLLSEASQRLLRCPPTVADPAHCLVEMVARVPGVAAAAVVLRRGGAESEVVVSSGDDAMAASVLHEYLDQTGDRSARAAEVLAQHQQMLHPLVVDLKEYGRLHLVAAQSAPWGDVEQQLVEDLVAVTVATIRRAVEHDGAAAADHRWLDAAAAISQRLLSAFDDEIEIWQLIARTAVELAVARNVTLCMPSTTAHDRMRVMVAAGPGADLLAGSEYPVAGSLAGQVMDTGQGQLVGPNEFYCVHSIVEADVNIAQTMAVPLQSAAGTRGALVLSRSADQEPFTTTDVRLAGEFANQAVLGLELAQARALQQRIQTIEDRERIAADLHDHVIQQLFATGLRLQGSLRLVTSPQVQLRLTQSVDAIDETIGQIRNSIFELTSLADFEQSLRAVAIAVVTDLEPTLGMRPYLRFSGAVDATSSPDLIDDLRAVLREALTNVAKHAHANHVEVEINASDGPLTVTVRDDGVGLGPSARRSGRANLERRATRRGGGLVLSALPDGGTELKWSIPDATPVR